MIKYSIAKYPKFIKKIEIDLLVKSSVRAVSRHEKILNRHFDLSFVSPLKIKQINKRYRKINKSTDVISFAFSDSEKIQTTLLGEVFICVKMAKKNSKKFSHSLKREICFLVVHGLLHLLGYDHQKKTDERKMIAIQKEIMNQVNILK